MITPIIDIENNNEYIFVNVYSLVSASSPFVSNKFGTKINKSDLHNSSDMSISFYGDVVMATKYPLVTKWLFVLRNDCIKGRPISNDVVQYVLDDGVIRKRRFNDLVDVNFISKEIEAAIRRGISEVL